ncbi:NHL domain-containing thioredoxin family protein [Pseudonocardia pini]|uniref:NHL domain-containing thioredoxin family protein n=1 Tax=Pseudonocardia pini TaxID=2758030 RepID=UPI0015F056C7|nr:NHL domain-containing thioredoxin family protein [Pseudonocardia pini]
MRVRAPRLQGRRWLNTGGQAPDLRGKIVVLDFWTFCCVNCLHVLDELRPLEEEFGDVLVVVGVHSPKFAHEGDPAAVEAAVERYGVHHPVLDDPDLAMWDAYAARAWPTLAVIDPEGYVVAQMAGEGHAHGLAVLLRELVEKHAGVLRRGDSPYVAPAPPEASLRFPGKVIALGEGFLVSDTAHHQVVLLDAELAEVRRYGSGRRGFDAESFAEPQGLARVLAQDYDVVVADSVNHALRGLRLSDGRLTTIAGTGAPLRERVPVGGTAQELSTPWDVAWWDGRIVVAMAGVHQIWTVDPTSGQARVLAGTTNEGLRDGPVTAAFFAQPSGLAVEGDRLWIADAETSAVRSLSLSSVPQVSTAVGLGLFDFGFRDGPAGEALLQHPLGVGVLPDGSVAVADTYNGAIRRIASGVVTTLAEGLAEPSDVLVDGDTLVVVESAAHRLVRLPIPTGARVDAGAHTVRRPTTDLAAGPVTLRIDFTPPTGQHLDTRFGDPTVLTVAASPPSLLVSGGGTAPGLARTLELGAGEGVLSVSVAAAACDEGDAVFAACHRYQQDWGVPVRVGSGPAELVLDLRAVGA